MIFAFYYLVIFYSKFALAQVYGKKTLLLAVIKKSLPCTYDRPDTNLINGQNFAAFQPPAIICDTTFCYCCC